jgi:cysteine desulfurase family protein (TIGR01976 family)
MQFDVEEIRAQFPALMREINGFPVAYLDGPGGVQLPQRVVDKVTDYLVNHNANIHGVFATTVETDAMIVDARKTFADFFGCSWEEVSFGANSTTMNFNLAHALARDMVAGDEILITDIDHEANRGPWEILAERGIVVREAKVDTATCTVDLADFKSKLTSRTKVAAFNYASNGVGTISPVREMVAWAHAVGAVTVVDAVHYALHGPIDVVEIDTDYLFCSAYKFFGPHVGILFAKKDRMEALRTIKVGDQENWAPLKFETGTLNHEGIAGAAEAVEFIAAIGSKHLQDYIGELPADASPRRQAVIAGMLALEAYEQPIAAYFLAELAKIKKIHVYGPPEDHPRTSTVTFSVDGVHPRQVAEKLAEKGIFVWDGNFFATKLIRVLGFEESGGLVRIGLAPYNTLAEIDRTLEILRQL